MILRGIRPSSPSRAGRTGLVTMAASLLMAFPAGAQVSPEEHAKHHPEKAGEKQEGAADSEKEKGAAGGMMGGKMGGMMEKMGAPKPKDLYPSLMSLPDLPLEKRAEVQQQARQRMHAGTTLMGQGLDELSEAASNENHAAMQEAVAKVREGLSQLDSGLAAKRALAEGKAPRNVALHWFKREMNLLPPAAAASEHSLGGSAFHLSLIVILGTFAGTMIWMYFFKMRRASVLLKELATAGAAAPAPTTTTPTTAGPTHPSDPSTPSLAPVDPPEFPAMRSRTEPVHKWSGKLRVCRIFDETSGVKTFRLAAENDVALPFTYFPGQFVTLSLEIDGKVAKRSYTIASTPTQLHYCGLTIKREDKGLVSRFLHDQIREGDLLDASGPNGKFTFTGGEEDGIVLIGGGVGITPLMSVVRYLTDIGWNGDIFLLYCCRTTTDFIFRNELEQLQERHPNLHVFATMTRAAGTVWMGMKGRFTPEIIGHLVPDIAKRLIHVCGPPPMMNAVLDMLGTLQVPDDRIRTEAFGPAKKPAGAPSLSKTAGPDGAAQVVATVVFKSSAKSGTLSSDQTVLDAADAVDVKIDNSCRSGQCGLCNVRLLSGKVTMECDDALSDEDKANGLILACQAKAAENLEVDA